MCWERFTYETYEHPLDNLGHNPSTKIRILRKFARGCEIPGKIGVTAIALNRLARGRVWNIMGAVSGATNLYTGDLRALVDAKKALASAERRTFVCVNNRLEGNALETLSAMLPATIAN